MLLTLELRVAARGEPERRGQCGEGVTLVSRIERGSQTFGLSALSLERRLVGDVPPERERQQGFVVHGVERTAAEQRSQLRNAFAEGVGVWLGLVDEMEIALRHGASSLSPPKAFFSAFSARCSTTSSVDTVTPSASAASSRDRSSSTRIRIASA